MGNNLKKNIGCAISSHTVYKGRFNRCVSPFILSIQCKLCSDVTGIWCTEALLAGLGAFWDRESGWSCSSAPDGALEDLSDRPHDVASATVQMFFLNHKSSNVIHVFS